MNKDMRCIDGECEFMTCSRKMSASSNGIPKDLQSIAVRDTYLDFSG